MSLAPFPDDDLAPLVDLLAGRRFVALTGAGCSTESGIPDYRGGGRTGPRNPIQHDAFMRGADVRRRYWARATLGWARFSGAEPNAGHRALAELERKANVHTLVTQNVDGLHQAAGSSPAIVIEIHGTVHEAKCLQCGWRGPMDDTLARVRAGEDDPACLDCGGMLKSATISFGENLVPEDLMRAQHAAQGADVFLAVGTSLGVYPAAALPEQAYRAGASLAILNGEPTPFDDVADFVFRDRLGEVLPALVDRV